MGIGLRSGHLCITISTYYIYNYITLNFIFTSAMRKKGNVRYVKRHQKERTNGRKMTRLLIVFEGLDNPVRRESMSCNIQIPHTDTRRIVCPALARVKYEEVTKPEARQTALQLVKNYA